MSLSSRLKRTGLRSSRLNAPSDRVMIACLNPGPTGRGLGWGGLETIEGALRLRGSGVIPAVVSEVAAVIGVVIGVLIAAVAPVVVIGGVLGA